MQTNLLTIKARNNGITIITRVELQLYKAPSDPNALKLHELCQQTTNHAKLNEDGRRFAYSRDFLLFMYSIVWTNLAQYTSKQDTCLNIQD